MTQIYGKDFASIYNEAWAFWGPKMWPFLYKHVKRRNPNAKTWLDLCCGTGSLLRLAYSNGFVCTGLDFSAHQLKYAKQNVPKAIFVHDDIRKWSSSESFDVITCMYDSLNYLTNKKDLQRVFRNVRKCLADKGLFAFDINTFEGLQDKWNQISIIKKRNYTVIIESSFGEKRALGKCVFTGFIKQKRLYRKFEEEHIERGYRAAEIEEMLKKLGFSFTKYDGDALKRPLQRPARLLYICKL